MKFYNLPILPQRIALLIEIGELKWTIEKRNMLNNTKNGSHEPREREQGNKEQGTRNKGTRNKGTREQGELLPHNIA